MSKIGRKPISFSSAKVEVDGSSISISGSKAKFTHEVPAELKVLLQDKTLVLSAADDTKKTRSLWGLHRALLANKIKGVETGFEQVVKIVGHGYKAQLSGKKLVFSLGYSHKIDYTMPADVSVELDKPGQLLTFKSYDKALLGHVCDEIRKFRLPEPYKGTGIIRSGEKIIRKAGKTGA